MSSLSDERVCRFLDAIEFQIANVPNDSAAFQRLETARQVLMWVLWIPPGTKATRDFPQRFLEANQS